MNYGKYYLCRMNALDIVQQYYHHFNTQNWEGMLSLLSEGIRHEVNQGEPRIGLTLYREFLLHMDECYQEQLTDMVFFSEPSGQRIAVEFTVNGIYKKTDGDLIPAHGQRYVLPAGAFLEVAEGKIARVTTYYNLPLWIKLVSA
jgi:steroid delta-isomerase-like uncharacterized protein